MNNTILPSPYYRRHDLASNFWANIKTIDDPLKYDSLQYLIDGVRIIDSGSKVTVIMDLKSTATVTYEFLKQMQREAEAGHLDVELSKTNRQGEITDTAHFRPSRLIFKSVFSSDRSSLLVHRFIFTVA